MTTSPRSRTRRAGPSWSCARPSLRLTPLASETISCGMPAVRVGGRLLVSYAAFTKHCSLFPASGDVMAEVGEQLAPYFAERSTLRFAPTDPIPAELPRRIVEVRLAEVSPA